MAYANAVKAVAVAGVIFLVVMVAPQWAEAQPMPEMDAICAISIPEIVKHCYTTMSVSPSEECCKDLQTASKRETTCLCDNIFANPHPLYTNITKVYFDQVNIACSVVDKYKCNGANGRGMDKIAASVGVLVFVASLFF